MGVKRRYVLLRKARELYPISSSKETPLLKLFSETFPLLSHSSQEIADASYSLFLRELFNYALEHKTPLFEANAVSPTTKVEVSGFFYVGKKSYFFPALYQAELSNVKRRAGSFADKVSATVNEILQVLSSLHSDALHAVKEDSHFHPGRMIIVNGTITKDFYYKTCDVGPKFYTFSFVGKKKRGLCPVCGASTTMTGHHIIPKGALEAFFDEHEEEYKQIGRLPNKNFRGNVFPLCPMCHSNLETIINRYLNEPLPGEKENSLFIADHFILLAKFVAISQLIRYVKEVERLLEELDALEHSILKAEFARSAKRKG